MNTFRIAPSILSADFAKLGEEVSKVIDAGADLIQSFGKAGADIITFHPEASKHIDRSLSLVKSMGCQAGLVLNPATPVNLIENVLDKLDMVLLMSVNPGFGGQSFIPHTLIKIRQVRGMLDNYESQTGRRIALEVDGGIKTGNIAEVAAAGADTFVAGSAIFSQPDYKAVIDEMRKELAKV